MTEASEILRRGLGSNVMMTPVNTTRGGHGQMQENVFDVIVIDRDIPVIQW
jgi:hypothetical protein